MTDHSLISSQDLKKIDSGNSVILDVRSKMEHDEKRLAQPHINLPLDELDAKKFIAENCKNGNKSIYILCGGGTRARKAADKFIAAGYENIKVIDGGLRACEACGESLAGYSTKQCSSQKTPISLERQVRIAAGLIIFFGSLLTLLYSTIFAVIPLFVGGGLVFAGITDNCTMALILAKAPWNNNKKTK